MLDFAKNEISTMSKFVLFSIKNYTNGINSIRVFDISLCLNIHIYVTQYVHYLLGAQINLICSTA